MVCDIDLAKLVLNLLLLDVGEVVLNLDLGALHLFQVEIVSINRVLRLDEFEPETIVPVTHELLELLLAMERGSRELGSPEGCVRFVHRAVKVVFVGVRDHFLVVGVQTERPNVVLFETVVSRDHVGVWRIRVQRLALNVVKLEHLVVVFHGKHVANANDVFVAWTKVFHSLKVVSLIQVDIVNVILKVGVVFYVLAEACEVRVQVGTESSSGGQRLKIELHTIVDLVVGVLVLALVISVLSERAAKALTLAVPVNTPQVIDTIILRTLMHAPRHHRRCHQPEEYVHRCHSEEGYTGN